MTINILAPEVAAKIAAGEVVERPASVVKELIENSLDAGARHIAVEARSGGLQSLRVVDDGCGIPAEEVELAFHRHATSKLSTEADLAAIATLGFRGEALPSIAAVAEVTLVSRTAGETAGYQVQLQGGAILRRGKAACPVGTTVTVRQLFRHLPVRLKFLRSAATEGGHIASQVQQYALAFPEVAFTLHLDGRLAFRSPGNGQLREVVAAVYSLEVARALVEVDSTTAEGELPPYLPRLWGLISPPSLTRASPGYQSFFLNRRWVQSRTLRGAVAEAYRGHLMVGRYPVVALHLALPPAEVDVNVHPTKREVRFRSEHAVFDAVRQAVAATLNRDAPVPSVRVPPPWAAPQPLPLSPQPTQAPLRPLGGMEAAPAEREAPSPQAGRLPLLRVMGQVAGTYIVAEGPDGIYLVDQHTAHERVLYEKLREQRGRQSPEAQGMLQPAPVELTPQQAALLEEQGVALASYGFDIEPFGPSTCLVRGVPAVLAGRDLARELPELLDALRESAPSDWGEAIAISLACHGAVRAGQSLTVEEMRELLRQLEATASPTTCPHGRPIVLHLSQTQLEREFGRR